MSISCAAILVRRSLVALALLAPAAHGENPEAPTATPRNFFVNPGFELGREGWAQMGTSAWGEFEVQRSTVHAGKRAVHLSVRSAAEASRQSAKVFGVVQELTPEQTHGKFPDKLSGWYRVESWEHGTPGSEGRPAALYVQAVVIVWGDPRTTQLVAGGAQDGAADPGKPKVTNYQIRYYLAGIDTPPFRLKNARFKFVTTADPVMRQWVRFELDVRKDFEELWGVVPENYEFVRVLFEGRFDNKPPGAAVKADVYYDDVYFGD